jgi:pantetheine-phosphate adenylyltransferase
MNAGVGVEDGKTADGRDPIDYRHAVYAGSFDPITLGHAALIERAARLFDRVTLAIGFNPKKLSSSLFTVEERIELLESSVGHLPHVEVCSFSGLLIDFCRRIGAGVIVRGLRVLTDFEYEFQLGLANRDLEPRVETTFLLTEHSHVYISSSLVKEIAANGGEVGQYVSPAVARALTRKLRGASE